VAHRWADCISQSHAGKWDKTKHSSELAQRSGGWQWQQETNSAP